MEKIKTWRRFALALLALLFTAILSFALVQIIPARADEELVLPGNTATYEIINDERETLLWTYKRSTNEWTSANSKSDADYKIPTPEQANKLTLKVTGAGNVAFKWKLSGHWAYLAIAVKHYKAADVAEAEEDLSSANFTYVVNRGYQSVVFDKDRDYGGDFTGTEKATSYDVDDHEVTIECGEGDYITIEALWNNNSSTYGIAVKGLELPTKTFTVNAKVADGQESLGTLKADRDDETGTNTLAVHRGYDESVTFTAVPNEGAVTAYWTDSEGNKICPTADFTVSGISEKNDTITYIAHFVTKEDMKPVSAEREDGTKYWETDESGKTTLDLSLEYKSGENPNYTFGIVIPEGGAYLEIDYTYWTADDLNSNQLFIDEVNMWGSSPSSSSPSATAASWLGYKDRTPHFALARTPRDKSDERPTEKYLQWVGGAGYYTGKINIQIGSYEYTEGDEFSINSINVVKQLTEFEEITLDFNSELTTMTMKYQGHDDPISITANESVKVPVGLTNVQFTASQPSKTKTSKYDESKTVNYYTRGFSADKITKTITNRLGTTQKPYENFDTRLSTSESFYLTFFSKKGVGFSSSSTSDPLTTNDHVPYDVEEAKIKVAYAEEVPISLTATAMTDGVGADEKVVEGGFIGLPFGHTNSITLNIRKFEDVTLDDFSICVDREEKKNEATEFPGAIVFPLQISGTQTIEISYLKEDDNENLYSKLKLTLSVGETVEGTIDQLINHTPQETTGTVEITNDVTNAWTFDPVLSSAENYAFSSIMDMEKSGSSYYGRSAVSSLTFTMTGAVSGGLSFEFRSEGYFQEGSLFATALRVGQLWYRSGSVFTQAENSLVGVQNTDKSTWTETLADATWLSRPKAAKDGGMEFANNVVALDDGWYQISIPIQQDTPLYLGFLVCGYESVYSKVGFPEPMRCRASIRNVRLATGNKTATLKIGSDAGEDSSATATVDEMPPYTASVDGQEITVLAGSLVKLFATVGAADTFHGWSVNGVLVSTETEASVFVNDDSTIVAWIAPKDCYVARADGTFYKTVEEAGEGASRGQTIYLLKDKLTVTRSFTIDEGVTLLLPYDETNKRTEMGAAGTTAENKIAWLGTTYNTPYRSLTVKGGATITVKGTLAVGGVVGYPGSTEYMGHTSGHYSEIILEKGSSIRIESGGVMDVYGRVWGGADKTGEDMGTIDVAKGGKLYEPFLILDFAGGSNAAGMFLAEDAQTPFKRYAMINIEVPMTINYGGALVGHASLYALNQYFSLDQTFIGDDSALEKGGLETFVMLTKGSKVTITYDPQKQVGSPAVSDCTEGIGLIKMVFEGGAKFSYMMFSAMGVTVPTNPVYFSIPYNYEVEMNGTGAQYETRTDFMILPGAKVTVGKGATLTLNANAYVYDGLVQGNLPSTGKAAYPTAEQLGQGGYSKSGNFIVNGTLKIGKKTTVEKFSLDFSGGSSEPFVPKQIPATFLGIIQTNGTGRIEIPAETVLKGKILNGVAGNAYYFAYTTTARVWDSVHKCFGDLEAGRNYTAAGSETFTLNDLHYTNAEGSPETQNLTLNSDMVGCWKVDHTEHHASAETWQYRDEDGTASAGGHEELHRYCDELGCEEQETRYLLGTPDSDEIGSFVYRGTAFSAEELVQLFKENYAGFNFQYLGFGGASKDVTVSASDVGIGTHIEVSADGYTVTVTLSEGAYFLQNGQFVDHFTFKWRISAFDLGGGSAANAVLEALSRVYDGTDTTIGVRSVTAHLWEGSGTPLTATDYTVSYEGDRVNVTEAGVTVKIAGQGNYTGTLELTYRITPKAIVLTLDKQTADYSGNRPSVNQSAYSVNGDAETLFEADIAKGLTVTVDFAESPEKWDAKLYDLTVTLGGTGKDNYSLTADGKGKFEIAKKDLSDGVIALSEESIVYDGNPHEPFAGFTLAGFETLAQGTDYTVTYEGDKINVTESVTVKVTGSGNFKGEATKTFQITARNIAEGKEGAIVQTPDGGFVYKGAAWTPDIEITIAGVQGAIAKDTCYTLGYANNEAAGTATVTVTGTHNFNGSFELSFTIARKTLTIVPDYKSSPSGQPHADLTATAEGLIASDREKFESAKETIYRLSVSVTEASGEGTYDITVDILLEEWDNYSVQAGDGANKYTVTPAVFAHVKFTEVLTAEYDGEARTSVEMELGAPGGATTGSFGTTQFAFWAGSTRGDDGSKLTEMQDAGKYYVEAIVTFNATDGTAYTATYQTVFEITPKSIAGGSIVLESSEFTYTGEAIVPTIVSVTVDTLRVETYSVTYDDNVNAGMVTMTVTASGNFKDSVDTRFEIKARSLAAAKIEVAAEKKQLTYNGGDQTPAFTVTLEIEGEKTLTLTQGKDFDFAYSDNRHVGTAGVTITGKDNFEGSATEDNLFEIVKKAIEVRIAEQSHVYAGTAAIELAQGAGQWSTDGICGNDDLHITLSLIEHAGKWDVNDYPEAIDGTSANEDYEVTFVKGTLKITPKAITVTIGDHRSQYGDEYEDATFTVEPSALAEGDEKSVLGVTLTWEGASGDIRLTPGSYYISGQATPDRGNYTVTFTGSHGTSGTYSVDLREVTVKILPQEETYDNKEFPVPQEQDSGWTVEAGSILDGEDLNVTLEKDPGTAVTKEGYTIRGRSANPYYHVTWQDGTFTVKPRPVVVLIRDQSAMYVYDHNYAFDEDLWTLLTDEGRLAENEEKDILGITLSVGELTNAGKYAISGAAGNENYTVTFRGSYEGDTEELVGKAGVYTVEKQDVSGAALFILLVGDGGTSDGMTVHAKFAGKPLALTSTVTVFEGQTPHSLASTLDRESVAEIGNFDVKVTVVDDNYSGEAVFLVIVTDEVGYTKNLKDTLARLAELAEGLDAEHLTTDDYGTLVEIYNALSALTDEERSVGAGELARYQAYVDAWEQLTDIDDVIKTAEEIANAPIKALFGAAATLTALAALAYIVKKGGRL